ncbi:MAG: bifunctional folylpolyglutamate synthase/dihydrofolate synthase, partial [Bacteroidota bacterium]
IKPNRPVVIGETQEEVHSVFEEKARACNTKLSYADQNVKLHFHKKDWTHTYFDIEWKEGAKWEAVPCNLIGEYQKFNLQTALHTIELINSKNLLGQIIDAEEIRKGLYSIIKSTYFIGRWQILEKEPLVLIDSAHNESGIQKAMKQLHELLESGQDLHIVWGMSSGKTPKDILSLLPTKANYYFAKPDVPRGIDVDLLMTEAKELRLQAAKHQSIPEALAAAKRNAKAQDVIFVGGSIFVVGEVV